MAAFWQGRASAAPSLTVRPGNDMGLEGLPDNHHYSQGGAYSQLTGGRRGGRSTPPSPAPRKNQGPYQEGMGRITMGQLVSEGDEFTLLSRGFEAG